MCLAAAAAAAYGRVAALPASSRLLLLLLLRLLRRLLRRLVLRLVLGVRRLHVLLHLRLVGGQG